MSDSTRSVIIIGSGPSGYTAAIYAARASLKPLLISGPEVGGQLTTTTEVENYPGFPEGVQGPELMNSMKKQAERFGTEFESGKVTSLKLSDDVSTTPHTVVVDEKKELHAKTIIIATGASAKRLGIPSEETFWTKGISACATCDGYFFKDKPVVVVGGGDVAMEEAIFLSKICTHVTVLIRKTEEEMKASEIMRERAQKLENVTFMFNTEVDEFLGSTMLEKVRVKNNKTEETEEIEAAGTFVAIGHKPNSDPFADVLPIDKKGYIHPKNEAESMETEKSGVFVAGDINDFRYRQAVTAAGEGCKAAMDAEKFLDALGE